MNLWQHVLKTSQTYNKRNEKTHHCCLLVNAFCCFSCPSCFLSQNLRRGKAFLERNILKQYRKNVWSQCCTNIFFGTPRGIPLVVLAFGSSLPGNPKIRSKRWKLRWSLILSSFTTECTSTSLQSSSDVKCFSNCADSFPVGLPPHIPTRTEKLRNVSVHGKSVKAGVYVTIDKRKLSWITLNHHQHDALHHVRFLWGQQTGWFDLLSFDFSTIGTQFIKHPVETAAEFQLRWYLARLKQSNVQRVTLREQRTHHVYAGAHRCMNCLAGVAERRTHLRAQAKRVFGKLWVWNWSNSNHLSSQFIGGFHSSIAYFCTML